MSFDSSRAMGSLELVFRDEGSHRQRSAQFL